MSLFDTLLREAITQLNNNLDVSGININSTTNTNTTIPRSHIEELIYSAISEELFNSPLHPSSITSSRTTLINEEEVIDAINEPTNHTIPDIYRSELYEFGYNYQRNMGDYISSVNHSISLIQNLYNTNPPINTSINQRTGLRGNVRYPELDDMLFSYNRNVQNYNENIHLFLDLLSSRSIPSSIPIPSPIPLSPELEQPASIPSSIPSTIPSTILPSLTTTALSSSQTLTNIPISNLLTNLLSRSDTTMYMLLPRIPRMTVENRALSPEHFSRSTELYIYGSSTDTSGNERERCPICFDEFQQGEHTTRILHCGHIFKTVPLNNWFLRSSTCPVCRYDLNTSTISPIGTSVDL